MSDPFEVRMRFTQQLQHLNASTSSATKAANYALRHAEHADDLHSCILEQLERNNMNNRANIMYFLPSLCDAAKIQGGGGGEAAGFVYTRMMERDILRIVDAVAPDDGSGAANVKVVRKVLGQLEGKGFLQPQTVTELEECIVGRDSLAGMGTSPPEVSAGLDGTNGAGVTAAHNPTPVSNLRDGGGMGSYGATGVRLDKRQVEQRIEEDRERHKRAREGIWAIPQGPGGLEADAEFDKMWDETSEIGEDDYAMMREEAEERTKCKEYEEAA